MGRPRIDKRNPLQKDQDLLEKAKTVAKFEEDWEESLKRKLFENDKPFVNADEDDEDSPYYVDTRSFPHVKRDGEWDVLLDESIKYFDPELSYQITGYRPITETQGLDFDPTPFCEVGELYDRTGRYTEYPKGSKPYVDFWNEQKRRCVEGYTVGDYRVTGDHYFFLNFYRMNTPKLSVAGEIKKTVGRNESFPRFLSKQYEFFHYFEMCEMLGFDVIMLKARGLGFSEILADLAVRPFITTRKFRTVCTAAADAQLDPLLDKCWTQLNWLNMNTNGGMKRSRQKVDNVRQKRASLVDKEGTEYGRQSEIEGIVADNPRKVRGDRTERLIFEEAGSNVNLVKSWVQGNSLVELGGIKIGIRIAGGTGGDSGPQLMGLSKMFWNPSGYNVLPFKHSYTRDGKPALTGYFIPAHVFALDPKYMDIRGVTDSKRFREYYENKWAAIDDVNDRLIDKAEHCLTPEDALIQAGDNMFDAVALSERLTQIKMRKDYIRPKSMHLLWDKNVGNGYEKVIAKESPGSKLLVVEPPRFDESGKAYKNLYVAGIDAVDMGRKDSATDYDVSDFCIIIKRRVFGLEDPRIVAIYKDRPDDIRKAYDIAMKLLVWYNCQALLEYTKISIQTYFNDRKKGHLFMTRPDFAIGQSSRPRAGQKRLIGVPGTEAVIKHGLELIAGFVMDYWYTIDYEEVIDQLLNYSYEMKRKFDIVAALQMLEIADESLTGVQPSTVDNIKSKWRDIGYYKDANGRKCKGIIPKR